MHFTYEHLDWRELANRMARDERMQELFRELMLVTGGDVDQALDWLEQLGERYRQQLGFDAEEFRQQLSEQGLIKTERDGSHSLSAKGEQRIRASSLEAVFGKLKRGGPGEHAAKGIGRGDRNGVRRPWQPGDESEDIDYRESLLGSMRSGHSDLRHDDLVVEERDATTAAATVMLIDVSHSMTLYGEDRITPAKRVALALAELQQRQYPRDAFHVLLFGDDVHEVSLADLPYISNGPFHTNTCAALERAHEILSKKHQPNKRVIMITDGKPTALFTAGVGRNRQLMINSGYGLDPQIVTATLNQGARLRRKHIDLSIFMVADDPYLERFVRRLVQISRGRAFRATLGDLGSQVLSQIYGKR
ncbi:MAG: VWA domain-containing protein [Planctomycetota bacterium]